ncbi:hypothetical protein [Bosea beijingensis]
MSLEHIRASLTPADLATANAAYTEAMRAVATKNEALSGIGQDDPKRPAISSHIRALEAQAEAAFERSMAELVYAKAAEAASGAPAIDYLAR